MASCMHLQVVLLIGYGRIKLNTILIHYSDTEIVQNLCELSIYTFVGQQYIATV